MPAPALNQAATSDSALTNGVQHNTEEKNREISQTDHINKKLLTSLFNRMDEGGTSTLAKMLDSNNGTEEDNEWSD